MSSNHPVNLPGTGTTVFGQHVYARIALLLFLALFLLSGCGLITARDTDQGAAAADGVSEEDSAWKADPIPYTVAIEVHGDNKELASKMRDLSQLEQLRKEAPDSILALERRAKQDQETAIKLLHAQCYYDGEAEIKIEEAAKPVKVILTLVPGRRFNVGEARVEYVPPPEIPEDFKDRVRVTGFWGLEKEHLPPPAFPDQIPGITPGKPVVADDMLAAVAKIPQALQRTGYPLARITNSLYTLDKPAYLLNANITVDPGPPAYMGKVIIKGDKTVHKDYLLKLVPWTPGKEPWDAALLEEYGNRLRGTGIFRQVEVTPLESELQTEADGKKAVAVLPAMVELVEGPPRSVSLSARYDTDTGFGVEGTWEHRNLFGNGEKILVDLPISQQEAGVKVHFEKPAFPNSSTRMLVDGAALWENTDAYQQESVRGSLGFEYRLARQWTGALSMFAEGGYLKDNEHEKKPYAVISPRMHLKYDGRNNHLNPTSGTELDFNLKPFKGYYVEEFGALAGSLALTGYYAPLGHRPDGKIDDTVVLAARAEAGAMPQSTSLRSIPASLRYFVGGAGSVRGYPYQSIGPKDSEGDPLGGRSYQVVNLEARFMVAENIGIVPFLDGGMVYREEWPKIFGDMDWGTGLGFRYYTPIGPVRLDVATPLQRADGDPPVQFYISIGQSF